MRNPWDSFHAEQRTALEALFTGRDWDRATGLKFLDLSPSQVMLLALIADQLRQEQCGDAVTYVINRNINFTNVCIKSCKFCAFSRDHRNEEGYYLPTEEILRRVDEAVSFGATEVCVQAGLPPKMDGGLYLELTRAIKARHPGIHLHAFSPEEVLYGAVRSRCTPEDYLLRLKDAGLDSLPGTSAEILDQDLRDRLAPGRINVQQWVEIVTSAHRMGLKTTSTMMFGHLETPEHWLDHMLLLRRIQEETGGFSEFVPLGFVHSEAPLSHLPDFSAQELGPSGSQVVHVHALARLLLGRTFKNIQASWVKEGEKLAGLLLGSGCNDLGGTLINESISTAAGASHGQRLSPRRLRSVIRALGRLPVQRNTLYGIIREFPDEPASEIWRDEAAGDSDLGSYQQLTQSSDFRFQHPNRAGV